MAAKKTKNKKTKQAPLPKTEQTVAAEVIAKKEESVVKETVECRELREPLTRKDTIMVVLYGLLMFVTMTVQTGRMSIILTAIALVLCIGKKPLENIRAHLSLPMIGLVAFAVMNGIGALHSPYESGAGELYKIMAAFSLAVILLARFEKKHVRGLLWAFATICAVIALVCVDMGSWGKLFVVFNGYVKMMGGDFSGTLVNSLGGRVNGIYNDANLTGALLGMAIFVSAYLAHTAEKSRERLCGFMLLGVSAVSFLVAMSRGAMLMFGIAVLVYLAVEGRDTRTKLFFLLLTGGGVSAAVGAVALMSLGEGNILPVLLTLVAGPVAFAVDRAVTARLAEKLQGRGKLVTAVCGGLVAVLLCGVVVAFQITEPYDFADGELLGRGVELDPGEYKVSGDWTGPDVRLVVYCRTEEEILMDRWVPDYDGPLQEATFVVDETTARVHFSIWGETGTVLNEVTLSDGTELPLAYPYLPEMITSRLQDGLLKGHNFQQRMQYLRDGMKLFKQSPLIGHGLGSTEYTLVTVQPYFYESLFVHNHLLQVMDDMGALGLAAFLLLLGGALFVLIRRRMKISDSLVAALIACWVMMNLHSLMEINFSVRMYQCAALFILVIPALRYAEPDSKRWTKLCGYVALAVICLDLAVFGSLLQSHRTVQKEAAQITASDAATFMSKVQSLVDGEAFDKTSYQLTYVANALILDEPQYNEVMHKYVKDLHERNTYDSNMGLAKHYYMELKDWREVFACSRLAAKSLASDDRAWNAQVDFYRNEVLPVMSAGDMDALAEGVAYLQEALADFNVGRMEEVAFTEENLTFVQTVNELSASGCSDAEFYQALMKLTAN